MQSFQQYEYFCQECGAANTPGATTCVACQHILSTPEPPPPVTLATPAHLGVLAGGPAPVTRPGPGALLRARYHLRKEVGQGGFASVYQARDRQQHNRLVAIKQIDLSHLRPHEVIDATDSFNREVTLLSNLKHRSLPRIYEHFTEGNCWYLVMEYIQGHTLEEALKSALRGHFSLRKTIKIGLALVNVLDYLHTNTPPIIFRDVKPANIMLTRTGRIFLIDFGIARRFSPGKKRDTTALGSPGYAAPEQYGTSQTDARTDIYGLGATLQTLLTGRDPLELRFGEAPRSSTLPPPAMQELLNSMMEAEPAKRPQDMVGLQAKLATFGHRQRALASFGRGLLFGGVFLAWLVLNTFLQLQIDHNRISSPPIQAVVLALTCFLPLMSFGTGVWQIVSIVNGHKRWFAAGVLLMLFLLICLTVLAHLLIAVS
jgi:serine/threonine protein kinase